MWLNLSSLIGDMQNPQQCAGERYLISLIIIIRPDLPLPTDCCPSPNFPLYRVDTSQTHSADACGSMLRKKVVKIKLRPPMPGLTEGVGYVLTDVVSCQPRGKRCAELMRPSDGEKQQNQSQRSLSPAVYWRPGMLI